MKARRSDPWDGLVEAPRKGLPEPAPVVARRRWYRVLVWSVLFGFVIVVVALAGVLATSGSGADQAASSDSFSLAKVAGVRAMQEWLASTPAPLVNGTVLTVDGVDPVKLPERSGTKATFSVVVVNFTLLDGFGQTYRSGVQVAVDPRGSAEAISTPSLEPIAAAAEDSWSGGSPWPGLETAGVPVPVSKAIDGWAAAYTSGDADTLRLAVGDPDGTRWYAPLSGVQSVKVDATTATPLDDDDTVLAVQVKLTLTWAGQKVSPGDDPAPAVTMDVLVERANTAAPVVTAWGAAGTGPNLVRYQNAVDATGRTVASVAPSATPSVSSSADPSPSASR